MIVRIGDFYHDSCDLIWKIAFTFVRKAGDRNVIEIMVLFVVREGSFLLKQIVYKISELVFYQNESWHKT